LWVVAAPERRPKYVADPAALAEEVEFMSL
jgi:hypothetical protein